MNRNKQPRYVFYNNTNGDIYWVKQVSEGKAQTLCAKNHRMHMSYILETELNKPVLNHMTEELDLTTTPYTVRNANNKGLDTASQTLKLIRDRLLQECDWTQGADSPLNDTKKTEWQTYRQALRDFDYHSKTETHGVTWPTKPS